VPRARKKNDSVIFEASFLTLSLASSKRSFIRVDFPVPGLPIIQRKPERGNRFDPENRLSRRSFADERVVYCGGGCRRVEQKARFGA
jgi:hypothetical protein